MILKLVTMFGILLTLVFLGSLVFRKSIHQYNPLTWTLVEFSWYAISFAAVCIGLVELERIEKLNLFKEREKQLVADYYNKRGLLHAQTWLLKLDPKLAPEKAEGIRWFHTMKSVFDEGLNTTRWEGFLLYSRSYVLQEPGVYADPESNLMQFNWPLKTPLNVDSLFLKEEIRWVVDTLKQFKTRKDLVASLRPEENTNYRIRYYLIMVFLLGLSLKLLKIYADYKKATRQ